MCWFIKSMWRCSKTKLLHGNKCVILRRNQHHGALSVSVISKETYGSLPFGVATWSAMTAMMLIGGALVRELDVHPSLTWVTSVYILVSLRSVVFPSRLPWWLQAFERRHVTSQVLKGIAFDRAPARAYAMSDPSV